MSAHHQKKKKLSVVVILSVLLSFYFDYKALQLFFLINTRFKTDFSIDHHITHPRSGTS